MAATCRMPMCLPFVFFIMVLVAAPRQGWGYFCTYPTQQLTGLALLEDRDQGIKLDLTLGMYGPECQPELRQGRLRCSMVGARTLDVRFTAPARGKCPGPGGRIVDFSYERRSQIAEPTLADVSIVAKMGNGVTCTIIGVTASFNWGGKIFGGRLPFLIGSMTCEGPGAPVGKYEVELLRLPLPPSA